MIKNPHKLWFSVGHYYFYFIRLVRRGAFLTPSKEHTLTFLGREPHAVVRRAGCQSGHLRKDVSPACPARPCARLWGRLTVLCGLERRRMLF